MDARVVTALGLLAGGCSTDEEFVCTLMTKSAAQCTEYHVSQARSASVSATCAAEGGEVASRPCDDEGSLGTCSDLESNGIYYKIWVYPSTNVPDASTGLAYCTALKGKWKARKA